MDAEKLVTLINLELLKDKNISVNKICNKIAMKQSTVKTQLKKNGYSYNAEIRQYVKEVQTIQKHNTNISALIDIDINDLRELISIKEELKELIQKHNTNIIDIEKIELKCNAVTEVKQKLFKVDVEVAEKWDKFVLEHKEYKVQQLISTALEEFINKYN